MNPRRFDPEPGNPYARCLMCDAVLDTQEDAHEHMASTMQPVADDPTCDASGHSVRIKNQTRAERIQRYVDDLIEDANERWGDVDWGERTVVVRHDAYADVAERLRALAESGDVGWAEIRPALDWEPDYRDAWDEVLRETDAAPDPVHPDQLDMFEEMTA